MSTTIPVATDSASARSAGPWIEKSVALKFRFGEVTIFRKSFRVRQLDRHFLELPPGLAGNTRPLEGLPRGVQGMLVRSHPVGGPEKRFSFQSGAVRYIPASYQRYFVKIEGTFDAYLARFSSKSRSTLKRKVKKFTEHAGGALVWKEYRTPDEIVEFHRLAVQVSRKTYQERLLDAGLPATEAFAGELAAQAARGEVRGYLLFMGERPVAYICAPLVRGSILLYHFVGFDPDEGEHSPGTVLQFLVLEHLFAEGVISHFDFTEGEGPHKEFFATDGVRCADVYWFRRGLGVLFFVPLHLAIDAVSSFAGRCLDKLGLKRRIKSFLRRKA